MKIRMCIDGIDQEAEVIKTKYDITISSDVCTMVISRDDFDSIENEEDQFIIKGNK